jgi:predicted permease
MNNAKYSKAIMAVFNTIAVAVPFVPFAISPSALGLASAASLSLAIGFGYFLLYSLQILPSFVSTDPFSLLSTLPFDHQEFSAVTMFSFLRTVDYIAIGSISSQVIVIGLLTHSAVATILMFVAAIFNLIFAAFVGLWLSKTFYRNLSRGGRSKVAGVMRFIFLVTWAFAGIAIGFVFNFISYAVPLFSAIVSNSSPEGVRLLLSVLHPFSTGITISSTVYPGLLSTARFGNTSLFGAFFGYVPYVATFGYIALGFATGRKLVASVRSITLGRSSKISRQSAKEFILKVRTPIVGYVIKDLRISSKNPATAFVFALPFLEIMVLLLNLSRATGEISTTLLITLTMIGSFFIIMACIALVNAEGGGIEFTSSLPVSGRTVVLAKALVSSLVYVPVPIVLFVALRLGRAVLTASILVPFVEIFAVGAAALIVIILFMVGDPGADEYASKARTRRKRLQLVAFSMMSGTNILRMVAAIASGITVLAAPVVAYAVASFTLGNAFEGIAVMLGVALAELCLGFAILARRTY